MMLVLQCLILLLCFCHCEIRINPVTIGSVKKELVNGGLFVYTHDNLGIKLEAENNSETLVNVISTYFDSNDLEAQTFVEVARVGIPFHIRNRAIGSKVRVQFEPKDSSNYIMNTSPMTLHFVPHPIEKLIQAGIFGSRIAESPKTKKLKSIFLHK